MPPAYTTDANTAISDPDVMLTSAQTQAVAIVIREMATNAAKHGALWSPAGRVSVNWDRTGADRATILTITWREPTQPPIQPQAGGAQGNRHAQPT